MLKPLDILNDFDKQLEVDFARAEQVLHDFLRANPDHPNALLKLAKLALRKNDPETMERASRAVIRVAPERQAGRSYLSLALSLLGRYGEAADLLAKDCAGFANRETCIDLGTLYHRSGDLERALHAYERALDMATDNRRNNEIMMAKFGLARVCRDLGLDEEVNRKVALLHTLFKGRPLTMSSLSIRFYSSRDFHEWDLFKRKDHLADMIGAAPSPEMPGGVSDDGIRVPVSFNLPRDGERFMAFAGTSEIRLWIVKPNSLFGGQGIRVVDDPAKVPLDEDCVVQEYLANPALVEGKKAHLRLYLLILSHQPLEVLFWQDGLARFAPDPFVEAPGWLDNMAIHVTNTALHHGHPGIVFSDEKVENFGTVWGLRPYLQRLARPGVSAEDLMARLTRMASAFVTRVERTGFFDRAGALSRFSLLPKLIGMDVVLDDDLNPWFIEIQRNPGQTGEGPVNAVNGRMFTDTFCRSLDTMALGSGAAAMDKLAQRGGPTAFVRIR